MKLSSLTSTKSAGGLPLALNLFNINPFIDLPDSLLAYMNDLLVVQSPGIGAFLPEHSLNYIRIPRIQPVLNPNIPLML